MATEEIVVMIPGTVQHHPKVSMAEDGQSTALRSMLPAIISQTP
jgi:hypothetical protein